jgi:hypothetical protein
MRLDRMQWQFKMSQAGPLMPTIEYRYFVRDAARKLPLARVEGMSYFNSMRKSLVLAFTCLVAMASLADQVEMQNGDRYGGRVVSLSAESVVLQSDLLGKITLPRAKVARLSVGAPSAAASAVAVPVTPLTNRAPAAVKSIVLTNGNADIAGALRHVGANTNFIEQIRGQFLAEAGPAANQQFNEMLGGLMSGKIDLASLRAQAKTAADQLRSFQHDLGPEAGDSLSSYLAILDNFLRETGSAPQP